MDYAGFAPHRPGRIHLWCPECGRKLSNMPRAEVDPLRAVLARVPCPRCAIGSKDAEADYLDARGKRVPWDERARGA